MQVFIVMCDVTTGDSYYKIDSVWTSRNKARKRKDWLNKEHEKEIVDNVITPYQIKKFFVSH